MPHYRFAGQDFNFPYRVPELEPYRVLGKEPSAAQPLTIPTPLILSCRTVGLVGGEQREVEVWSAPPGLLLKVAGGSDFYIAPGGACVVRVGYKETAPTSSLTGLDREILLGPALVLALALRGTWCLHASAVILNENLIVFLGETGQGKSTLAAYLANGTDWRLAADDILPVTADSASVEAWPRFPQLKLPMQAQTGPGLPERLSISKICVLTNADTNKMPELQFIPPGQSIQVLLRHTAGTRLFEAALLAEHLAFCAKVAEQIPVYRLIYPHRKNALPKVGEFLESSC